MLEHFTEDAELVFEGVPAGPFHGQAGDRRGVRLEPARRRGRRCSRVEEADEPIVARYAWRADDGRPAGRMIFTTRGDADRAARRHLRLTA